jgi:hypothetical protein
MGAVKSIDVSFCLPWFIGGGLSEKVFLGGSGGECRKHYVKIDACPF